MPTAAAAMELKLKVVGGKNAGVEIAVAGPQFLIGRADECQLRPKSDYVSRRHAALLLGESRATLQDLGSRTGTFLNGQALAPRQPAELKHDDVVKIGPLELAVVIKHGLDRQKRPKVGSLDEAAARTAEKSEDVDVTQWLQPAAQDLTMNDTLDSAAPGVTIMSASDLIGQNISEITPEDAAEVAKAAGVDARPDQAASDMLKNYLRRR